MTEPHEVFLRSEAIESLRRIQGIQRRRIAGFIESLALDPFLSGDYSVQDSSGRFIHIKILGSYAVTFWADHPVREIKMIDIRRVAEKAGKPLRVLGFLAARKVKLDGFFDPALERESPGIFTPMRRRIRPFHHKDPFDRMLVAQCQIEGISILSSDPIFDAYGVRRVW